MNILIYKIKIDVVLLTYDERRNIEATTGMHIIITNKDVYLKRTSDSFCVRINTYPAFIEANSNRFEPISL